MAPEFEAAAFSMQTNQISDIVTTQYGYHIIKMSEKIPAHKLAYDEVKKKIKDYLDGTGDEGHPAGHRHRTRCARKTMCKSSMRN